jgi:hypothetical protein
MNHLVTGPGSNDPKYLWRKGEKQVLFEDDKQEKQRQPQIRFGDDKQGKKG